MADSTAAEKEYHADYSFLVQKLNTVLNGAEKWERIFVEPSYALRFSDVSDIIKRFTLFTVAERQCFTVDVSLYKETSEQPIQMRQVESKAEVPK